MKFTKENVLKVFEGRPRDCGYLAGVKANIEELDDTPEKVIVPKFVAEFYEDENRRCLILSSLFREFEDAGNEKVREWYWNCEGHAQEIIAKMRLNGYEIEKEPLYEVIIANQYLIKRFENRTDYHLAWREELQNWAKSAYQLTESEIKSIDERFWAFAVKVEEER